MGIATQESKKPSRAQQKKTLLTLLSNSQTLCDVFRNQALHLAHRYGFNELETPHPNGGNDLFKLVCVCFSADGWFLADGSLLRRLASTDEHKAEKWTPPKPDTCQNPINELQKYFSRAPNCLYRYYNKVQHNPLLAQAYIDHQKIGKLNTSRSFRRICQVIEAWLTQ